MKSLVVGTAGHIDHGKSALVRALTGTDPDRLQEEKRRGITIDLGFAHRELLLPGGEPLRLSLVDVPGHERFVRNMLAGAGGLDLALLVIAANEGVMPQTREHFEICRLLGLRGGVVALTKTDLATAAQLEQAGEQARALVRGSFLEGAPLVPVSSRTGAGLGQLESALLAAAAAAGARSPERPARLPVDRVFTPRGFGAVVTGTLISGRIAAGAELELWAPEAASRRVRVRGVQVHDRPAPAAVAGERTALNLAGVEAASLARGMVLGEAGVFRPSRRWDVALQWLPGVRAVPLHVPVRLHLYSTETIARLVWSGSPGWAQLLLRRPLPAVAGDHFILRRLSPPATLGGGVVLDSGATRANPDRRTSRLARLAVADAPRQLAIWAEAADRDGLDLAAASAVQGRRCAEVRAWAEDQQRLGRMVLAGAKVWTIAAWTHWERDVVQALEAFHQAEPLAPGVRPEALAARLPAPPPSPALARAVLERLAVQGQAERQGELWRRPGRGAELSGEERAARERLEAAFLAAGFRAPAAAEVLAEAGIDARRADKILRLLIRDGVLLRLTPELLLHRDALTELRQLLAGRRAQAPRLSVADFKALAGVTRKHAIPLLEYLDRVHATRRVGDEREILS